MEIELQTQQGVTVAVITGEIDSRTVPDAQAQLVPLTTESTTLVMDMSGVTFMSSAGLRMLLLVYRQVKANDGRVALVGLAEAIRDTMSITGFLGFFKVYDTVEDALGALKGG